MDYEKIKSYEPLIKKCIGIYLRNSQYYEDALQEGYLTIAECMKNYDSSRGIVFAGYVKRAVLYAIRDFSLRLDRKDMSMDEESGDGGSISDFIEGNEDVERDCIKSEEIHNIKCAMQSLTSKQRQIIYEYYYENKSLRDISGNRRCHYMSVVNLKSRAIEKLREKMVDNKR